jgi:hypothetical protein
VRRFQAKDSRGRRLTGRRIARAARVSIETTHSEIAMDDETSVSAAPTPIDEILVSDAPTPIDQAIDRWFGDFSIPNHYQAAKEDLKRRLRELPQEE